MNLRVLLLLITILLPVNAYANTSSESNKPILLDSLELAPEEKPATTLLDELDFSDTTIDSLTDIEKPIASKEPIYLKVSNKMGHLPLVIIALMCCWLFSKVTGLDIDKILTKKRNITSMSAYTSYYKRYWKIILLASIVILSIIFLYFFISIRQTPERCILKYAVHVKSNLASSILEHACKDLYDGSRLEKKVAKCKIKNIPKANNNTAVELAENVCNEYY